MTTTQTFPLQVYWTSYEKAHHFDNINRDANSSFHETCNFKDFSAYNNFFPQPEKKKLKFAGWIVLHTLALSSTLVIVARESLQLFTKGARKYFKSKENMLECAALSWDGNL